jgi:hypothetical protein
MGLKRSRGRPPKYYPTVLAERRRRLAKYFGAMTEEDFGDLLSKDCQRIAVVLLSTHFSEFTDRPIELAAIMVNATQREDFPKRYRASQSVFLADAIIAADCNTSIRYLRRILRRANLGA